MNEVTRVLHDVGKGTPQAAEELLSLVYEELRKLAVRKMAGERPGQTLQPTALVHEAWLRLFGSDATAQFQNRGHFFGAAAEAMRRILVDVARRRITREKGGYSVREELDDSTIVVAAPDAELLAVHECLDQLAAEDPIAAELVKLRYFVGMTMPEAADILRLSLRSSEGIWTFAKAWLRNRLEK